MVPQSARIREVVGGVNGRGDVDVEPEGGDQRAVFASAPALAKVAGSNGRPEPDARRVEVSRRVRCESVVLSDRRPVDVPFTGGSVEAERVRPPFLDALVDRVEELAGADVRGDGCSGAHGRRT